MSSLHIYRSYANHISSRYIHLYVNRSLIGNKTSIFAKPISISFQSLFALKCFEFV
uniref:Uncharacterized protein n=1 Tax=Anguilla anguilla TaxID=7936 RepID=A0A0E9QV78_ANGAN